MFIFREHEPAHAQIGKFKTYLCITEKNGSGCTFLYGGDVVRCMDCAIFSVQGRMGHPYCRASANYLAAAARLKSYDNLPQ